MAGSVSSRRVLLVSFAVNVLDVVSNLVVAWLTGSAVVFAEMAKGLADSTGSALLVLGERRSRRPTDARHPHGYAREAFFWGLLSAVAMLVIGAGLSAWRGYTQLVQQQVIATPTLALAVVAVSILTNGYAARMSARKLVAEHGSLRRAFAESSRPLVKSALLRDAIGTFTSIIGLLALLLYMAFDLLLFDALGALAAAVMMVIASLVLMTQVRALIVGQSLPNGAVTRLRAIVNAIPGVKSVNSLAATYSGVAAVSVDADLDLDDHLATGEIEALLDLVEERLRDSEPRIQRVRVELNSPVEPDSPGGRATP